MPSSDSDPDSTAPVSGQRRHEDGPDRLVLVRHGQSVGNLADAEARRQGASTLDLEERDADVQLSSTGREQAQAVGRYLAEMKPEDKPTAVLVSPYRRATETAEVALEAAGSDLRMVVDERLRERDLGAFDGLTAHGIRETFPKEAEHRGKVGKLYYRPPGGESWCDVALRVRSVLADLRTQYQQERLWIFSHQAVIMNFRLVLEHLSERDLLEADRSTPVANCSMTAYRRGRSGLLELETYGDTTAVDQAPTETTAEPSASEPADAVS